MPNKLVSYISKYNLHMVRKTIKRLLHEFKDPAYSVDLFTYLFKAKSLNGLMRDIFKENINEAQNYLEESERYVTKEDNYYKFLFVLTRICKPEKVIETGVKYGYSSQALLQAMELNNKGHLYSIDLPNPNCNDIGGAVPETLRSRWEFISGDARKHLPPLLKETGNIDFFLHDSLHTFDHMSFEYKSSWPYIKNSGFLISHDIHWNRAFRTFTDKRKFSVLNFNIGIVKKECD